MIAGSAHTASPHCHDPVARAMGTVRAAARAAPVNIAAVHRPVAAPVASGSFSRTRAGTSPEASAIPSPPRKAVTKSTTGISAARRPALARTSTARAIQTVCGRPMRWASHGTMSAATPMTMTGSVVSSPMVVSFQLVACWISSVSGGIAVRTARRLSATRASVRSRSHAGVLVRLDTARDYSARVRRGPNRARQAGCA